MPEKKTLQRAAEDKRRGKAPGTQAGEFIREEIHHIREGKHGARSAKQAIAIGLSKARRAGVELPPPKGAKFSEDVRRKAQRDYEIGHGAAPKGFSVRRSEARKKVMRKEGLHAASHAALSRQARSVAHGKSTRERSMTAQKAARTREENE